MRQVQMQKGITLIALVITVIILIILAGVAINLTLGENGIFRRAENAQKLSDEATVKEKIETGVLQVQIEEVSETGKLTLQKLYENLESKDANITLNEYAEGDMNVTGTYTLNGKIYGFTIDSDFNVTIGEVEEAEPQPLSFGEITWSSNKASITITSEISAAIEYQVNGTADGSWTQGKQVTNLNNGDIVYARINDGTTITEVQEKEIKDTIKPEEFEITTSNLTYESLKISGSTTDNQTGLATYSYVAAKSGTVVKEIKDQTVTEYTIEGLSAETEYVVYMLAYDNAGNVRKSNEVTVKTDAMPVAKMFGQYVDYGIDLNDNGDTTDDWMIFYKEDGTENPAYKGATYIIPAYYVPYAKMQTSIANAGMNLIYEPYGVNWNSEPTNFVKRDNYNKVKEIFMYDYTEESNTNVYAVSRLLDTTAWEDDFVTPKLKAKGGMAIGGPTINMWCASWNKAYPTEKLTPSISGMGYLVNEKDEISLRYTPGWGSAPNVYFPTKDQINFVSSYWIVSPATWKYDALWYVYCEGGISQARIVSSGAIRPLVYLPSSVTLEPSGTPNLWNINYGN